MNYGETLKKLKVMKKYLAEKQMPAVRYIVNDVDASVEFYTNMLGFEIDQHVKSALTLGNLKLFINSPGAGGAGHAMPDGTMPAPGGWNRFQLQVTNIDATVEELKKQGANFRNEIVKGIGGKQINYYLLLRFEKLNYKIPDRN